MPSERDKAIAALSGPDAVPRMDGDTARELVEFFLDELEMSMHRIVQAKQNDDAASLRRITHQLKGAASGFGFPHITESAALLEAALLSEEAELSNAEEKIESLLQMCRNAAQDTYKFDG